jgi:hypothetical protein
MSSQKLLAISFWVVATVGAGAAAGAFIALQTLARALG